MSRVGAMLNAYFNRTPASLWAGIVGDNGRVCQHWIVVNQRPVIAKKELYK